MAEFWEAVLQTVQDTWAEVDEASIFQLQQLARRNWEALINSGDLVYPFTAIHLVRTEPFEGAMDSVESLMHLEIGYVEKVGAAAAAGDLTNYIDGRLKALRDAFVDYSGDGFQCMDARPTRDLSYSNPLNQVFLQLQAKAQGGILNVVLRCED